MRNGNTRNRAEVPAERRNIAAVKHFKRHVAESQGGIERPVEQARQSEHEWRAILRDFIAATNPSDYRWAPPSRRFVSSGLYLPSVERRSIDNIVIVVDTSGWCIGTQELEQFSGEINAIANGAQPESGQGDAMWPSRGIWPLPPG